MSPTSAKNNVKPAQKGASSVSFAADVAKSQALEALHSLHDQLRDLKLVAANMTTIKEASSPYPQGLDLGPDPAPKSAFPASQLGPKGLVSTSRPAAGPVFAASPAQDLDFKPQFLPFTSLPAELRAQIWQSTFEPRTIEVHAPRVPHYAEGGHVTWWSRCLPHPALLVCQESRELALRHYPSSFRLHSTGSSRTHSQVVRLNPMTDMLLMLGEVDIQRLKVLLDHFRRTDPAGVGLRRLGLNAACWEYNGAGKAMRIWGQTLFRQLEELALVLYAERSPPSEWEGGFVEFEDPEGTELYEGFVRGKARELREDGKWMFVGKSRLTVKAVRFVNGW